MQNIDRCQPILRTKDFVALLAEQGRYILPNKRLVVYNKNFEHSLPLAVTIIGRETFYLLKEIETSGF